MSTSVASQIVIVGAGQAGGWAARTLRERGYAGRVVLVGSEMHPPYERPPLSKGVLLGEVPAESAYLFAPDALQGLRLELELGKQAVSIDRAQARVHLADGASVAYDKLLLCTGGRPRALGIPGADLPGVFMLRTLSDALKLGGSLRPGARVVVIGGGWIGLEVAAAARKKDASAIVIELGSRLCARTVPQDVSEVLLHLHRRNGTEVLLSEAVTHITQEGAALRLALASGKMVDADVVVAGIGLVPNDELARAAELHCENGIVVDAACRTSAANIFAAGDVAIAANQWAGGRLRLESWQNAQNQAIAAASSALGQPTVYDPLPWFWSDQYSSNIQIYGVPHPSHQVVRRGTDGATGFMLCYLLDGRFRAVVGINAGRDLAISRRLIEKQTVVDPNLLADATRPLPRP